MRLTTHADLVAEITLVLGTYHAEYDVRAIASEWIRIHGYVGTGAACDDAFWDLVRRHELLSDVDL